MNITIIGSGFAAQQLVRALRRQDPERPIRLITADSGAEYHKPDLSHVFSRGQRAGDLIKLSGAAFAEQHSIELLARHRVQSIDAKGKTLIANGQRFDYGQLVLAIGAETFLPPIAGSGRDALISLNSLEAYAGAEQKLEGARSVLVIGAGLIGCELAMDLAASGRRVILADKSRQPLAGLLPPVIGAQLSAAMLNDRIELQLGYAIESLEQNANAIKVQLEGKPRFEVDAVICAAGLRANTALAAAAGLTTNRGIVVDRLLRTSDPDIYALGDCAEVEGTLRAYLQPTLLGANALAKTLLGQEAALSLPALLVRVKTPKLPLQLAGDTLAEDNQWQIEGDAAGLIARAFDSRQQLRAFVACGDRTREAIGLLRQLPAQL